MKVKNISINIFIIMICITAFFFNAIGNGYAMLALCLIPVSLKAVYAFRRLEVNSSVSLVIFISFAVISSMLATLKSESNKFIIMMIVFLVMKIILEDNFGWQKLFARLLFFITAVSVLATFMSIIMPNIMLSIAKIIFSGESFKIYSQLFDNKSYAGIYGQTGINAYVISMFIAFVITALFSKKRNKLSYILLSVGIIALLLTKKRSFLFANAIGAVVLFVQNSKADKNKLKKVGTLIFLVIVVFLVLRFSPATQGIMEKMTALEKGGDITNGRMASWEDTFEIWRKSPIFGVGVNTMKGWYGLSTHNVYIQLLAEMGIVGAVAYIALLLTTFRRSTKIYQSVLKDNVLIKGSKEIYGVSVYMQVVFIVYSFFGNPVYGINFMLPYIVFGAVMDSYQKQRRRSMR